MKGKLFMTLFAFIVFLSFGFRFGDWNFTIFWAVPVVAFIFSLIFSRYIIDYSMISGSSSSSS